MPLYDLMLLLDPGAPSDRQETILRDVQGLLDSGGNVVGNYDWGTRRMTFEIDHRPDAAYHLFQFETEGGGTLLERVDHSLKIMDGVLRHRIIRLKDGSPPPQMPSPDRRGGYEEYQPSGGAAQAPDQPEGGQPAAAPATAGTAAAAQPATPADAPAPAPAETPPPPDVADQEAGPAGGGGDDEAPSGPTAA
jgi:small subunit ribosomal protein S6